MAILQIQQRKETCGFGAVKDGLLPLHPEAQAERWRWREVKAFGRVPRWRPHREDGHCVLARRTNANLFLQVQRYAVNLGALGGLFL